MHGSYKRDNWKCDERAPEFKGNNLLLGIRTPSVMHLVFIHGRGRWWSSSSGNASAYDPGVIIFFQVTITAVSGRWLPIHGWGSWPWRWLWGVRVVVWWGSNCGCLLKGSAPVLCLSRSSCCSCSVKKTNPLHQLYQQQFCITACNPNARKCCKPTKWALDQNLTRVAESWGAWGCMSFLHAELPSQLAQSCSLLLTLLTTSLHL